MGKKRIMTDKQLQGLHDDIRDGISMIVEKKHYYALESELAMAEKTQLENTKKLGNAVLKQDKAEKKVADLQAKLAVVRKIPDASLQIMKLLERAETHSATQTTALGKKNPVSGLSLKLYRVGGGTGRKPVVKPECECGGSGRVWHDPLGAAGNFKEDCPTCTPEKGGVFEQQAFTVMPKYCPKCKPLKFKLTLDEAGFMLCPNCKSSYGKPACTAEKGGGRK